MSSIRRSHRWAVTLANGHTFSHFYGSCLLTMAYEMNVNLRKAPLVEIYSFLFTKAVVELKPFMKWFSFNYAHISLSIELIINK